MDLSRVAANALGRIERARNESVQPTRSNGEIVAETRNLFRRRRNRAGRRDGESRGRKTTVMRFLVFLLSKSNDDFVPSAVEKNRLQRCGLGYPSAQLSNLDRYPTRSEFPVSSSLDELEDLLVGFYPLHSLRLTGFNYKKADQGRRLQQLDITSVADLKKQLGQGQLFLVPKRDLRVEAQAELAPDSELADLAEDMAEDRQADRVDDHPTESDVAGNPQEDAIPPADAPAAPMDDPLNNQADATIPNPATEPSDTTESLPVIRRRRLRQLRLRQLRQLRQLRLRRNPRLDASYTDQDTPGEVSIRRQAAIRARETIRQSARVIRAGEETPSPEGTPSPDGTPTPDITPDMSPLRLNVTDTCN